jgi:hypothetical protein
MEDHTIVVTASADCEITCNNDPERGRPDHKFEWICCDGDLTVRFDKNGSPFVNGSEFSGRQGRPTRPKAVVKPRRVHGSYDYTVIVRRPGQTEPCVKDPQIIIDETHMVHRMNLQEVSLWTGLAFLAGGVFLAVAGVKLLKKSKAHPPVLPPLEIRTHQ